MEHDAFIISAIDSSPLNRGLSGEAWLAAPGNVPIVLGDQDEDLALFDDAGDGTYQVHFLFQSRGREAVISAKESFRRMFENYGAELIMGLVPDFRRDVKMLARWAGGKSIGRRDTSEGPCELFVLSKEMWSEQ